MLLSSYYRVMTESSASSQGQPTGDTDDRLARLREVAARFRHAIKRCDCQRLAIGMQDFPTGSCGDATDLLGAYLADEGLGSFMYVEGWRGAVEDRHSHAWLEEDGLIVDITADQFPEIEQPVIVTRHSDWHATFEREEIARRADYRIYNRSAVATLERTYRAILDQLERL
jgi:hypothetical protein